MNCPNCGAGIPLGSVRCVKCGSVTDQVSATPTVVPVAYVQAQIPAQSLQYAGPQKSKITAGLLGIILGGLGFHSFYLGHVGKGLLQIIVTVCTCGFGALWGFIEGILILAGSINTDANGVPLI